jgi:hypothetical protein
VRYLALFLVAFCAKSTVGEVPQFDRSLAISAGREYVESYVRWHRQPSTPTKNLDWSNPIVDFISVNDNDIAGYLAVYFPEQSGSGAGFAYFEVGKLNPGYMFLLMWGITDQLSDDKLLFEKNAAAGRLKGLLPAGQ